jgi:hypothetical protein
MLLWVNTWNYVTLPSASTLKCVMLLRVSLSVNVMLLGISVLMQEVYKETLSQERLHHTALYNTCRWEVKEACDGEGGVIGVWACLCLWVQKLLQSCVWLKGKEEWSLLVITLGLFVSVASLPSEVASWSSTNIRVVRLILTQPSTLKEDWLVCVGGTYLRIYYPRQ